MNRRSFFALLLAMFIPAKKCSEEMQIWKNIHEMRRRMRALYANSEYLRKYNEKLSLAA